MDNDIKWIVGGIVVFFALMVGSVVNDAYIQYSLQVKCIEARGEWIPKIGCRISR